MKLNKAFTLLELIIVIIIVGILAVLGLTQYTNQLESMRAGEAKNNLGAMRKLAYEYYLKNGTLATFTDTDAGIGTGGLPVSCSSGYYFRYYTGPAGPTYVELKATRCSSGGKTPQHTVYILDALVRPASGVTDYYCWPTGGSGFDGPYTSWPTCN